MFQVFSGYTYPVFKVKELSQTAYNNMDKCYMVEK